MNQIFLRNSGSGRYYAGNNQWTPHRANAMDLQEIERALNLNSQQRLGATEIIIAHDNPPAILKLSISERAPRSLPRPEIEITRNK
jgi:hypothetical protein